MRIGGVCVTAPPLEGPEVFIRQPQNIALWAQAVQNMDEFHRLCPVPSPPGKHVPNKGFVPDIEDKTWLQMLTHHNAQRTGYIIIKTLEPSKIEWDKVSLMNPKSWALWREDLKAAEFTEFEIERIVNFVTDANGLNEAKLEKARESFLHGRDQEQKLSYSPSSEPGTSPSGEPANASA